METYVEHHGHPDPAPAPATPNSLRLPDGDNFGVMELAENRHAVAQEESFDNFVPPQFLIDGWLLVVEGQHSRSPLR